MSRADRFSPQQVDAGLLALVQAGSAERASVLLEETQGYRIAPSTLNLWRSKMHRDRFFEIAREHAPEQEEQLIHAKRALLARLEEGKALGIEKAIEQLESGEAKDPSAIARNLAVVGGIDTRDYLLLTGRPTEVVEHHNADDLLRKIKEYVDSTAEEIPAELPELSDNPGGEKS